MLKIVSDPTQSPIREVDLTRTSDKVIVRMAPPNPSRDLYTPNPLGGLNRVSLAPRFDLRLEIIPPGLEFERFRELERMLEDGNDVYLFPNFDAYTRLSATLSRSTTAWIADPTTGLLTTSPGTFTNASGSWYTDDLGNFQSTPAANTPRFGESAVGKGLVFEDNWTNGLAAGHPSSGTPIWSAGTGTPTIAWSTEDRSPYRAAGGVLKVTRATGSAFTVTASATGLTSTLNHIHKVAVWVKGRGRVQLSGAFSAGGTPVVSAITSLDGGWRVMRLEVVNDSASSQLDLTLICYDIGLTSVIYIGPNNVLSTGVTFRTADPHWTNGSTGNDTLSYAAACPNDDFTVTACGLLPKPSSQTRLWEAPSATTTVLQFETDGSLAFYAGGVRVGQTVPSWASREGSRFWCFARFKGRVPLFGDEQGITVGIFVEGESSIASTVSSNPASTDTYSATMELGGETGANSTRAAAVNLQHVRVDNRAWTDEELSLHRRIYSEDAFRKYVMMTAGRRYAIADHALTDRYNGRVIGSIDLRELGFDPDLSVVA